MKKTSLETERLPKSGVVRFVRPARQAPMVLGFHACLSFRQEQPGSVVKDEACLENPR
jgi:hypothetical protein